jgi:WD40 repeat protein
VEINAQTFSADGAFLAIGALDSEDAKIFHPATGNEVLMLKEHAGNPISILYSPGSTRLATCGRDFTGRIWDAASGKETEHASRAYQYYHISPVLSRRYPCGHVKS